MSLLDDFPEWQAYQERVAAAEQARMSMVRQAEEAAARDQTARAEHDEKVREAVASGGTVPDPPPPVPSSFADAVQMAQQTLFAVKAEADTVLAGIAAQVEDAVKARVAEGVDRAAAAVSVLTVEARHITDDLQVLTRARRAVEKQSGVVTRPSRADLTRAKVSPSELVEAVQSGTDLTVPVPRLGMTSRVMLFDGSEPQSSPDGGEERRRLARLPGHDEWPRTDRGPRGWL